MYWSPFTAMLARVALLFAADIGPQLVAFDARRAKPDHHSVIKFGAAASLGLGSVPERILNREGKARNVADELSKLERE